MESLVYESDNQQWAQPFKIASNIMSQFCSVKGTKSEDKNSLLRVNKYIQLITRGLRFLGWRVVGRICRYEFLIELSYMNLYIKNNHFKDVVIDILYVL